MSERNKDRDYLEARVSVRGHGKFIYLGPTHTSRKGRLIIRVRVYR